MENTSRKEIIAKIGGLKRAIELVNLEKDEWSHRDTTAVLNYAIAAIEAEIELLKVQLTIN